MCDENNNKQLGIKIQKAHEGDVDGKNVFNIYSSNSYFDFKCSFVVDNNWGV